MGQPMHRAERSTGSLGRKVISMLKKLFQRPTTTLTALAQRRLLITTQFFPPDFAATGQLIDELAQQLSRQGHGVTIFTGQPSYAFEVESAPSYEHKAGVVVKRSRVSRLWSSRIRGKMVSGLLFCVRVVLHLVRRAATYDVVLLTTAPPFLPILGYLVCRLLKRPYVCLIYDLYPDIAIKLGVTSEVHWVSRLWIWANRQTWRHAQGIVVLSASMKARVETLAPEVSGKLSIIHSWASPTQITPMAKEANWFSHQHHTVERFTVIYSGNMGRCHDVDTVLDAAERLRSYPIQFVFIGGGAKQPYLKASADERQLSNCLFLPYQDKAVLPYSLTAGDLSLVTVSDGMEELVAPSKLYSALAAGRPIAMVCAASSYLNHMVAHGRFGASFENGDSFGLSEFILYLSRHQQVVDAMGHRGRCYLERYFTPDLIALQYSQVLFEQAVISSLVDRAQPLTAPLFLPAQKIA